MMLEVGEKEKKNDEWTTCIWSVSSTSTIIGEISLSHHSGSSGNWHKHLSDVSSML